MARCGCGSTGATGAAMESTSCINVTGAGTALDPFAPALVLDSAADNMLACGFGGLYARAPQQSAGDDSMLVTAGVIAGDYDFAVQIDPSSANRLSLTANGLFADSNITQYALGAVLAGPPPGAAPDGGWLEIDTTAVVVTGLDGRATVVFPAGFPNGVLSIVHCNGDAGANPVIMEQEAATVTTSSFGIMVRNPDASPVAGVFVRVNYTAKGW